MPDALPDGWRRLRLDELGTVQRGRSRHRPRDDHSLYGGSYPFVQTGDVKAAGLRLYNYTQTYNEAGLSQSRLWPPDTLCITIAANICDTAILGISACFPDSVVGFTASPSLSDVVFVKYALDYAKQQFGNISRGATQDNLSLEKMLSQRLTVPSLNQQRRIASILGAYDDLIEVNRRRIAMLEEMARGLFEEWFVRFRFPGHENCQIVDMSDGLLPEGWRWSRLGQLCEEVREGVTPAEITATTPYVGLEHIPRRSTTLDACGEAGEVTSTKLRFRTGDILFGKIRPYFHKVVMAPFEGVASSDAIIIRSNTEETRGLVLCVASSDPFVAHSVQTSNGTKMPRANWGVLARYPVPLPPNHLLNSFNRTVINAADLAMNYQAASRRLAASRDLLLPRLVSGELSVAAAERDLEAAA